MPEKLAPKPPHEKRPEPSDVREVSSGSGVSFAAAKVVIDRAIELVHENRSRKKAGKMPAGVA
jgi:hypothetical protein